MPRDVFTPLKSKKKGNLRNLARHRGRAMLHPRGCQAVGTGVSSHNILLPDLSVDPNVDAIQLDPLSRRCIFATLPEVIAAHDQRHPEQQA